jgi:23S rRNA pseudouridine1911/1915/1917 synthase
MAGLQKRGSIPEALPLPSSRSMNAEFQVLELEIPQELEGLRLDSALARLLPEHSRTRIKAWIEAGQVQVGRLTAKPRDKVESGTRIRLTISAPAPDREVLPETIALDVVVEDAEVMVIDKPAGLVVHPGAGNRHHTLQNALLGKDPALAALPRAGIVHRLDKDTSGLLVIARTPRAQTALSRQLLARAVTREYLAICVGVMTGGGTVDEPIGRHRSNRLRMAIRGDGRPARTHYRVLERFRGHSYLTVKLDTGRTHQIRVHLAHLKYPLVGDPVYGSRLTHPRGSGEPLIAALRGFKRQALHAAALAFDHPVSGARLSFEAPPPPDFAELLAALRADVRGDGVTPRSPGARTPRSMGG